MNRLIKKSVMAMLIIAGSMNVLYALEVETHKAINRNVALSTMNGFSLDLYLKNQLGFHNGYQERFNSLMVSEWLRDGGQYEDKPPMTFNPSTWVPYVRSANHFHNPIKPISQSINEAGFSGIWGTGFISGRSAIAWAQSSRATQNPGGYFSWNDSRNYFYNALTASNPDVRSKNIADTLRGLGQLMHLLQDMSVPAHTRNEGHYVNYMYENWVKNNANVVSKASEAPVFFDRTLLTQQPSAFIEAPVPIANLFSMNTYKGAAPIGMSDTTVGLAEWTNANFFSEDTINLPSIYGYPTTSFPFPNFGDTNLIDYLQQRAVPETIIAPNGAPDTGIWVQKVNARNEIEIVHFAKFGYTTIPMANLMGQPEKLGLTFIIDDECYKDYAEKLLPRAVGYSAALLDYFFRGTLEISYPSSGVYSLADGSKTVYADVNGNQHQQFTKLNAMVMNTTTNDEAIKAGTLTAVARYKVIPNYAPDLSNYPPDGIAMRAVPYTYSVSLPNQVNEGDIIPGYYTDFTFNFSGSPIPAGITDLTLQVVFKGTIGNEVDNAIAVGMKDLMEPTHLTFWNSTDMFDLLYSGITYSLYTFDLLKQKAADDANFFNYIDFNHSGSLLDDLILQPFNSTFTISFWDGFDWVPAATTDIPPARHIRLVALVESNKNNYVHMEYTYPGGSNNAFYPFEGVVNQAGQDGKYPPATPIKTFRNGVSANGTFAPFYQHFSQLVVGCHPIQIVDANGKSVSCPYDDAVALPIENVAPISFTSQFD